MIQFKFQCDEKEIATINNASDLFKKKIWNHFEEAVTQQLRHILLHKLDPLRDELENDNTSIVCNYDSKNLEFTFSYIANPSLADKIEKLIQ